MLSDHELRQLRRLELEFERNAPRLAARLRSFGRGWLVLRLTAAGLGALFGVALLFSGAGFGGVLLGLAVIAVTGWRFHRRLHQLFSPD